MFELSIIMPTCNFPMYKYFMHNIGNTARNWSVPKWVSFLLAGQNTRNTPRKGEKVCLAQGSRCFSPCLAAIEADTSCYKGEHRKAAQLLSGKQKSREKPTWKGWGTPYSSQDPFRGPPPPLGPPPHSSSANQRPHSQHCSRVCSCEQSVNQRYLA